MVGRKRNSRSGQSAIEFALLYGVVIVPLTFGIIFVAEMFWVWHSMVEFTRDGARYASTHCSSDGQNVVQYMQTHVPPTVDRAQFQTGGAAIIGVSYFQRDDAGQLAPVSCAVCGQDCVPDTVSVNVTNYQFQHFVNFLNLPPITMPAFPTSMPIESNGCDPENPGSCTP
jgi:hypothetical protein